MNALYIDGLLSSSLSPELVLPTVASPNSLSIYAVDILI